MNNKYVELDTFALLRLANQVNAEMNKYLTPEMKEQYAKKYKAGHILEFTDGTKAEVVVDTAPSDLFYNRNTGVTSIKLRIRYTDREYENVNLFLLDRNTTARDLATKGMQHYTRSQWAQVLKIPAIARNACNTVSVIINDGGLVND